MKYTITYYRGGRVDFRGRAGLFEIIRAVFNWARRGDCESIDIRKII